MMFIPNSIKHANLVPVIFLSYFSVSIITNTYFLWASESDFEDRVQIVCRQLSSDIM